MNKKQIQKKQDLAFELVKTNRIQEAKEIYKAIIEQDPNNDSAHHMLSFTYVISGEYETALKHITKAISLYKCCADYYNTAGSILRDMKKFPEAFEILKAGVAVNPNNPETYNNLGLVLNDLGKYDNALKLFEAAIALDPNAAFFHFNYSLTLLKMGNYSKGWREYEWRHRLTSPMPPTLPQQTDLKNRSFILHHEQGFGDTIQFIRYAQLLKDSGAKEVNVSVPEPLESLLKTCPYVDKVNADFMIGDFVIPMMSLPSIFEKIPAEIPYFNVKQKEKLDGFNIGIAWTSKKNFNTDCVFQDGNRILPSLPALAYKSAQHRLLTTGHFKQLSTLPVKLWCLQPDAEIDVDYINKTEIKDFNDTAEIMTQMDLIISIDTSVAHLAGALGKPTWLLLPLNSEWRWLVDRTDTPWYPSMTLFRQPAKDDWETVFNTLYTQLLNLI